MKGKREKGQYGYRDFHRRVQAGKVLFGAAMILGQLFARNFTDNEAAKNILTVMAILSVLPAANVAAPLLASLKYRTPGREFYRKMAEMEHKGIVLYDLVITSREQIMPVDAAMIHPVGTFACCEDKKTDRAKGEKFLNDMFQSHELAGDVRVLGQEAFFRKMESLEPAGETGSEEEMKRKGELLKRLSM